MSDAPEPSGSPGSPGSAGPPGSPADVFDLVVIVTVRDKTSADGVAAAFERMRPVCLLEPGCIEWRAYRSGADPTRFVLVERWASEEAWEAHGELSAIQDIYLPDVLPHIEREVHPSTLLG